MRKILTAFIFYVGATGGCTAQEKPFYCTHFGGMTEKICPVSMVALTLNHESFILKSVAVSGYVGKIDNNYHLFTTSEFYSDRSMADSVLLTGNENLFKSNVGKRITVVGKVYSIDNFDGDIFRPFAKIDVKLIR